VPDPFHLKNPPIVEAVIDFDCDLPPDLDLPGLEAAARQKYGGSYPKLRKRFAEVHEIKTTADASVSEASVKRTLDGFQLLQEDEKQLVQVRRLGYSFNRLAPYPGLDALLPEVRRTWEIFCELTSPRQIRRVQLRYINRILFPMPDDSLDLDRILRCGPQLPDEDGLALTGFLTQYSAIEKRTGLNVNSVLTRQPVETPHVALIFDNAAFDERAFEAGDWAAIADRIAALRRLKNRVFANTLSEECLNLYR
jgi:uncharacterized protein (TIGR04255 family)